MSAPLAFEVLVERRGKRFRAILVGSTAVSLMREARCPVLVLPRGAATGEPGETDPSASAAAAAAGS